MPRENLIYLWSDSDSSSVTLQSWKPHRFIASSLTRVTSMMLDVPLLTHVGSSPWFSTVRLCIRITSSRVSPLELVSSEFHSELWAFVSAPTTRGIW